MVVKAKSVNGSRGADGGPGGQVRVTYHPAGCPSGSNPTAQLNESATAVAGPGGNGGQTGWGQGSDQGEDQGENIGQFASGHVGFGSIVVLAHNLNVAGHATGGDGGDVIVTVSAPSCATGICTATADENVVGVAGTGGAGGSSGHGQGSDQGEDQGENIGQFASGDVHAGSVTVWAFNNSRSGDASGGDGGNVNGVAARLAPRSCSGSDASRILRQGITATAGVGGAAGTSGRGEGAGHRQRVSAAAPRSFAGERSLSTRIFTSTAGRARHGKNGMTSMSGVCGSRASSLGPSAGGIASRTAAADAPSVDVEFCRGTFGGSAFDVIIPRNAVCTLLSSARIGHDVRVRPGGILVDRGAGIRHDIVADQASGIAVHGGSVGHDVLLTSLTGRSVPGGNRICGIQVGHDFAVEEGTRRAGVVRIGSARHCAGNDIGHDLFVTQNAGTLVVKHNTVEHDALCVQNRSLAAAVNAVGHLDNCPLAIPRS